MAPETAMKLPRPNRFAVLSFLCVVAMALAMGFALSSLLSRAVSDWEWENTAAVARRQLALTGLDSLFAVPPGDAAHARWAAEIPRLFAGVPEVVRVKVWSRDADVLWSDAPGLIGRRFPDNRPLRDALAGQVAVQIKPLESTEHVYERGFRTLAEVYVPIFGKSSADVVGVLEVYKTPNRLLATIRGGQLVIWSISLAGAIALYLVLLPLTRQVYRREVEDATLRAHAGRLEEQVAERTRELRAALAAVDESQQRIVQGERLRALGEMAGGVAHDFNNVLAAILGRVRLVLDRTSDPELRRHFEVIEKVAVDAVRTVRRIQEFSRLRRARPFQPVDLSQIVHEVMEITRPRWRDEAQARGIAYDIRIDARPVAPVAGDPSELREALTNIVLNAFDAMPAGGRIELRTSGDDSGVQAVVADTGPGMSDSVRQRVFDPFFTTKAEKGTGLGLSVAYGIVTRHGGRIDLWSETGRGSTFTVWLPVVGQLPGSPAAERSAGLQPSARILLIDDDAEVRDTMTEMLIALGQSVTACADGASGLARFQDEPFDLVLTDLGMPGQSGWDVARLVRRRHPDVPVLLITGWADQIGPAEARVRDVDGVLAKPFTRDELAAALAALLQPRTVGIPAPSG
jgi:signal transduction histidine kinase/ActR/RegA family two-component response regulator